MSAYIYYYYFYNYCITIQFIFPTIHPLTECIAIQWFLVHSELHHDCHDQL